MRPSGTLWPVIWRIKHMRNSLLAFACLLTGCGASTSVEVLPPPPSLIEPCALPVDLPDRALDDREIEIHWGRDRSALRACGGRHAALATYAMKEQ